MQNFKSILIVGAGGIGSWLAFNINHLLTTNLLVGVKVTIADGDTVEQKNLTYQNYTIDDVFENKAEATIAKYNLNSNNYKWEAYPNFVTERDFLNLFDLTISAVDNTKFRKLLFETCIPINKSWIDLRAEGTTIAAFLSHPDNTLDKMLKTIKVEKENQSCQREFDIEAGTIQLGNRIIASIGAQYVLNWYRNITPFYPKLTLNV